MDTDAWNRWEGLLAGDPVDPFDIAHLLEEPDEAQLRRLVRTLPQGDEIFDRLRYWLLAPTTEPTTALLHDLGAQARAELANVARLVGTSLDGTASTIEIDSPAERPRLTRTDELFEQLFDHTIDDRLAIPGGVGLWEICYAKSANTIICHHICGPLTAADVMLRAHVDLAKSGRAVWLDDEGIHISPPSTPAPASPDPIDLERLQLFRDEVASTAAPQAVLAQALRHNDSIVRQNLAARQDLAVEILEQLASDDDVYVRCAVAENPTTPEHIVRRLQTDEHRLVRRLADKASGTT